ncbi:hypothetical protein EDB19DRAFT_1765586, partial [Suillus lakei]
FLTVQVLAGNSVLWGEPAKRAIAIALISALGQIEMYVLPSNWGPTYRYSYVHLNEQIERNERDAKDIKELRDPIGFRYVV